jgi:restriction endonuclease S subunit
MPEWPQATVGSLVKQRAERVAIDPDISYDTMGVRWYGKGAYLRPPSRPQTKTLAVARTGDFVFCRIDSQNGPFALVPAELDGALATNEFPLYSTDPERLDARFLVLCFSSPSTLALIGKVRDGRDGRARWKESDFEGWTIPLPSIRAQRKIIEMIDAVDGVVSTLEGEKAAAVTARAALLDRLIRDLKDNLASLTLRDVADWGSGGTPKADNPTYYSGDIPWATIGDVRGRYVHETARKLTHVGLDAIGGQRKIVPAGSVLVTMYGTIGRTAITGVSMATNQAICRGVPNERVTAEYLRLWVSSRGAELIQLGDGKTQQNISKAKIEAFPILVPSPENQARLVSIMTTVEEQIEALEVEIERAHRARTALLQSLLSRTVDVALSDAPDRPVNAAWLS